MFATAQNLQAFDRSSNELPALELSRLGRRWAAFFLALVKCGYVGIKAPIDAIRVAEKRVNKQTDSRRSAFRALGELEKIGYLNREHVRKGREIAFVVIRFSELFLKKCASIIKKIRDGVPKRHGYNGTRKITELKQPKTSDLPKIVDTSPTRARDTKIKPKSFPKKRSRLDPLMYSVKINATGRARNIVLARAQLELSTTVSNPSGVDWDHWRSKWMGMSFSERDFICRTVIIPALADKSTLKPEKPAGPEKGFSDWLTMPEPSKVNSSNRGGKPAALGTVLGSLAGKEPLATEKELEKVPDDILIELDPSDLAILTQVRENCRARMKEGYSRKLIPLEHNPERP
jgi:hypothetical protein